MASALAAQTPPAAAPAPAVATAAPRAPLPPNPTRDPSTAGHGLAATELPKPAPAAALYPADPAGNDIIRRPTHNRRFGSFTVQPRRAPGNALRAHHELGGQQVLPRHRPRRKHPRRARSQFQFQFQRSVQKIVTSHPAPYTRHVAVYVPKQYVPGTAAPFIVGADGVDRTWPTLFDNMIAAHRLPVMIGIFIGNGGGDAQGSERGLEYDTMSGDYAEFIEPKCCPRSRSTTTSS